MSFLSWFHDKATTVEDQIKASFQFALTWLNNEVHVFATATVAQLKQEFPTIEHQAVSLLETMYANIAQAVETEFKTGDLKWSNGLTMAETVLKALNLGSASATLKDALLQDAATALKAGVVAAITTGNPTQASSLPVAPSPVK